MSFEVDSNLPTNNITRLEQLKFSVDEDNNVIIRTSSKGSFSTSGLSVEGKITEMTVGSTAWVEIPSTPLTNRNTIAIQNQSNVEMKFNYESGALGVKARATVSSIVLRAISFGTTGNSISIVADGLLSIQTLVDNWNTANPSNTVEIVSGDTSTVLSSQTITLSGGAEPVAYVGWIIGSGGEKFLDIKDDIKIYLRAYSGTGNKIVVEELS